MGTMIVVVMSHMYNGMWSCHGYRGSVEHDDGCDVAHIYTCTDRPHVSTCINRKPAGL